MTQGLRANSTSEGGSNFPTLSRRHLVGLAINLAFAAAVLGYFHDRFWWAPDEGTYAHVADRLLRGDVLNRDVHDVHPGYIHFVNALSLRIFGDDLLSMRYPLVAMGLLGAGLLYLLFLNKGVLMATAASASFTSLTFVQYLNPTANWYCLFLIIVVLCALSWMAPGQRWRLEIVGFVLTTLTLFRQLTGIFSIIGVLAYLLLEAPSGAKRKDSVAALMLAAVMGAGLIFYLLTRVGANALLVYGIWPIGILLWVGWKASVHNRVVQRILFRIALGGIVAASPLVLYHAMTDSTASWLKDTVIDAARTDLAYLRIMDYNLLITQGIRQAITFDNVPVVLNGFFWFTLPLLGPALGFLVLRNLIRTKPPRWATDPLPLVAVFYFSVSLFNQIPVYLFFSVGLILCALLWIAGSGPRWPKYAGVALAGLLSAVGLYYQAAQPLSRQLGGLLRGERVTLVRSVGLERCGLWIDEADLDLYTYIVELVRSEVAADETILAIPVNPELYFLTQRDNPLRFWNSIWGIHDNDELLQVINTLEKDLPKLVFYRAEDKSNTIYSKQLMAFVKERYSLLEETGGFEIYIQHGISSHPPPQSRSL